MVEMAALCCTDIPRKSHLLIDLLQPIIRIHLIILSDHSALNWTGNMFVNWFLYSSYWPAIIQFGVAPGPAGTDSVGICCKFIIYAMTTAHS